MSICKKVCIFISITTLLLCSFPLYAYADDTIYELPINEPPVNENSGYLVLYMQDYFDSDIHEVWVVNWTLFQTNTTVAYQEDVYSSIYLDAETLEINTEFQNDQSSGYLVVNLAKSNGDYTNIYNAYHVSGDYFELDYYTDDYMYCVGYRGFVGNSMLYSSVIENQFNYAWNDESNLFTKLDEIMKYIDTLESLDSQQLAQLKSIYSAIGTTNSKLDTLQNYLMSTLGCMDGDLHDLYSLTTDLLTELEQINYNTDYIEGLLNLILQALNQSGDSFVNEKESTKNKDTTDSYYSKSDDLTGKDTSDDFNSVQVDGSSTAFREIWDLIDNFVEECNSKVFGLYASVLSIGIIALILNR